MKVLASRGSSLSCSSDSVPLRVTIYETCLKPNATPHAQVWEELQRMETLGVMSKVDVPTDWCMGMVVVPKKNGNARICSDLKPLNENVLWEMHPLPHVDEMNAILKGLSGVLTSLMPSWSSARIRKSTTNIIYPDFSAAYRPSSAEFSADEGLCDRNVRIYLTIVLYILFKKLTRLLSFSLVAIQ